MSSNYLILIHNCLGATYIYDTLFQTNINGYTLFHSLIEYMRASSLVTGEGKYVKAFESSYHHKNNSSFQGIIVIQPYLN